MENGEWGMGNGESFHVIFCILILSILFYFFLYCTVLEWSGVKERRGEKRREEKKEERRIGQERKEERGKRASWLFAMGKFLLGCYDWLFLYLCYSLTAFAYSLMYSTCVRVCGSRRDGLL
jgi:hypothetical protein